MNKVDEMVRAVITRPLMYTQSGTFNEVVAFLDGYYSGVLTSLPLNHSGQTWFRYREFLASSIGCSGGDVINELSQRSGEAALEFIRDMYPRFIDFEKSQSGSEE